MWFVCVGFALVRQEAVQAVVREEAAGGGWWDRLTESAVEPKRGVDDTWRAYLAERPAQAVEHAASLQQRAADLVGDTKTNLPEVDVVISGGGNLDAYYLGASMVFSRAGLKTVRHAGASAGGMMPFELALKGETETAEQHLAYAVLCEEFKSDFSFAPYAAYLQDKHWRIMAAWQTEQYADKLAGLDDKIYLALSCLSPLPKLVKVHTFNASNAASAFMGTGTMTQWYDGMLCSDGGAMSGKKMTPLFQDHARPQVIVDLMATGYPVSVVLPPSKLDQQIALAELGQDHALAFLKAGAPAPKDAITLCPKDAQTDSNVCVTGGPTAEDA